MFAAGKSKASASTDPYFNYVPLLLPGDGTNGAQNNTFVDGSTNNFTITRNGNTTQGSFSPYGSLWSNNFKGSGDGFTVPSNTAFAFGTGDFTVEAWIYARSFGSAERIITGCWDSTATNWLFTFYQSNILVFDMYSGGSYDFNTLANYSFSTNTWYHVAVTRSSSTIRFFINGVKTGSDYSNTRDLGCGTSCAVAATDNSGTNFDGYISNLRIVKGTAVYTGSFTPPAVPLTAITNTSLLTCQSNRFIDNSSNAFTVTLAGTPAVTHFSPFLPTSAYSTSVNGGSGYFDGSADYLDTASSSSLSLGTSDFTIEWWMYISSSGHPFDQRGNSLSNASPVCFVDLSTGALATYRANGTVINSSSAGTVKRNEWAHVAWVRSGTDFNLYYNGVLVSGPVSLSYNFSAVQPVRLGDNAVASGPLTGYLSDFRYVIGTAVYTGAFTPPTAPLTAVTNTQLLCSFTNAGIYDNATINDSETVGNAQISTSVKKFGTGSMAFDGTGDYLTFIDKPELQLGTGNFTVEGWVYLSATGVAYGIVSKGTSTTGWSVNVTSGNKLQFSYTSSNLTGATSLSATTWYHFAVVRNGSSSGNLVIYLNGTADATSAGAVTDTFNQTSILYVGADRVAGSNLNGNIDDLRITNGVARYTANFTAPTSAFPTY